MTKPILNNRRRLLYLIAAIAILVGTIFLIPPALFENNYLLISTLAGVSSAYLIFQAITDYKLSDWKSEDKDWRDNFILVLPVLAVALPIVLLVFQSNIKNKAIDKDGIITKGIVIDGSSYKIKRNKFYEVIVRYTDQNSQVIQKETNIDAQSFAKTYKGMEVDLIYYPSDPELFKLILTEQEKSKYLNNR